LNRDQDSTSTPNSTDNFDACTAYVHYELLSPRALNLVE
jgi:hypothetical protein